MLSSCQEKKRWERGSRVGTHACVGVGVDVGVGVYVHMHIHGHGER